MTLTVTDNQNGRLSQRQLGFLYYLSIKTPLYKLREFLAHNATVCSWVIRNF